jgi:hypothetical protein
VTVIRIGILVSIFTLSTVFYLPLSNSQSFAQGIPPLPPTEVSTNTPEGRELLHLAAIGTYSAGFVLETYGYIGVLADVLHYGVYEPEVVRSMLVETQVFLEKSLDKIKVYRDKTVTISDSDLVYINGIGEIIVNLMAEAESLSNYCQTFDKTQHERYIDSRAKAWAGIKLHLGIK